MHMASREQVSGHSLNVEESSATADLNALFDAQEPAEYSNAIGAFRPGLPLSSMSGGDKEALVASPKGRLDAIEVVQASRDCE